LTKVPLGKAIHQPPEWLEMLVKIALVGGLLWIVSKWLPLTVGLIVVAIVVVIGVHDALH
jgi:hypothetical protein